VLLRRKALRFNAVTHLLEIQRNVRASAEFRTHQVSLGTNGENGSWVRSIQKGDVIEFMVRAEYPAWVNITKSVEMEILYEPETEMIKAMIGHAPGRFEYLPLPSAHQIRLISIHPGSFDDALNCTLIHSDLDNAKISGFEALSYCWGDPTIQKPINMEYNEKTSELGVSETVESIMRHLRRNDGRARKIWIDVICVNQSNYEERAQQVALMTDVYSMADVVNVWLNPSTHITALAFLVIRDIYNYRRRLCPGGAACTCPGTAHTMVEEEFQALDDNFTSLHGQMDEITQFHLRREPYHAQEALRNIMQSHYTLISELLRNPWFRRVWVLQEVINSQLAILNCSEGSIPWKELIEITDYQFHHVAHLEPLYRLPQIWMHLGRLRNPSVFPPGRTPNGEVKVETAQEEPGILDVILEALELDATDPRDKIFALLSFGRETNAPRRLPELIRPDYTKSVDRVFTDFTRWWINEYKSLRILSMVHANTSRTWQGLHCPFDEPPPTTKSTWTLRTEGMYSWATATLDSQFEFRASGDSIPAVEAISSSSDPHQSHLRLLGYKVAQIEELSHYPLHGIQLAENTASSIFEAYQRIFEPIESYGRWKSLQKRELRPSSRQGLLQQMAEHLRAHWLYEPKDPLSVLRLKNPVREGSGSVYERVESKTALPCHGSCFFVASDGSIGLCPAGAMEGDWITILLGGKVPFLLRELYPDEGDRQHFELVGECYSDGKMHGEFVRDKESQGLGPEYLVLV
jgi:hypothetical protein